VRRPGKPSPRGALGELADPVGELFDRLAVAAGERDLEAESLFVAEALARVPWSMGDRQRQSLALLIVAALVNARQGSTRLPIGGGAGGFLGTLIRELATAAGIEIDMRRTLRDIDELCRADSLDRVVGRPGERLPLIATDGSLYLERHHGAEARLIASLRAMVDGPPRHDPAAVAAAVAGVAARPSHAGGAPLALSDEQAAAVAAAAIDPLAVISGGPGTGKTAIVVALLRVLVRLGVEPGAIALAAPTGKAAQRIGDSIDRGLASIADPAGADRLLAAATPDARTVHRLLGYAPRSGRFRHHRNHPLPYRFVVVDEASMLDLELTDRLVAAIAGGASLVLLGDADQLPSVEAGAVLRELVLAGAAPPRLESRAFAHRLTRSFRMRESARGGRALLAAAARIRAGESRGLVGATERAEIAPRTSINALTGEGVELLESPAAAADVASRFWRDRLDDAHRRRASAVYRIDGDGRLDPEHSEDLEALFDVFERSRLLTASRRGEAGCDAINRRLHREIIAATPLAAGVAFYPGEPVLMRLNDYDRDLFNGEQGIVLRVGSRRTHEFRAVFRGRSGGFRGFVIDAVRHSLDLAFAITVHQSQGSEADEVLVILGDRDVGLLTRELIYTGVTRARRSAVIAGSRSILAAAVGRGGERFSGIAAGLGKPPK
jgi:exodeoxyribonuclease V alpha subunit